ncbi:hypothetical protein PM3016_6960 [Paenibacillus mucilaginosus 3016]|uniref:DUF2500 domain-containing protein n=2 Tax=Paenibacillus mucilaginosus TaxID=61624 RepID=H6NRB6_9BACL|nr:DUF2500 domain-containing protein [Paenibacillus mucilaginosus]AFC33551.1 hypothetical protein PM3016_6960 [Paenibacillus mucilaginosus 3016]AFH65875.1 hypothetical protein B2K_35100 [Paenibacillus mucilaginosus K02]WFA21954.1 DUF2500 domain-containing protein [Paenibacillus mucilaginosus]
MPSADFGWWNYAVPGLTIVITAGIGFLLFRLLPGLTRSFLVWRRNNAAERLTLQALVVAKRSRTAAAAGEGGARTAYYITFELTANGEKLELPVAGSEYGLLVAGDHGQLICQGTRFHDFVRRTRSAVRTL